MNWWLIAASALSVLAAISGGIGLVVQQRRDVVREFETERFQTTVSTFVDSEAIKERPEVSIIGCSNRASTPEVTLRISNHGRYPADRVSLITVEHPLNFAKAGVISFQNLPNGVTTDVKFDVFDRINGAIPDILLSDDDRDFLSAIKEGRNALVSKIRLEYTFGESSYSSPTYTLLWWPPDTCHISQDRPHGEASHD